MIWNFLAVFLFSQIFVSPLFAQDLSKPNWDPPKKIDENTVFLGEKDRQNTPVNERLEPQAGEKNHAWRLLELGNNYLLAGRLEQAAVAFAKCYEVGGPTRVLSGFKLVEVRQKLGHWDEAIAVLEDMKQKYLVSTKEFGEAARLRAELEDAKRKSLALETPAKIIGREWLLELQDHRMKFVLQGMNTLRVHGVPLKEAAHKYVFLLDEYFIAHPEAPADVPAEALAVIVYEHDIDARLPIDRWRRGEAPLPTPDSQPSARLTGAEWVRVTHNEKMDYILGAMEILKTQNVPMQRSAYAYVYEADRLFTEKPELSASDSVVTLASILYNTEPEARDVLEALRLK